MPSRLALSIWQLFDGFLYAGIGIYVNFIIGSIFLDDILGLVYSLINLTSAASESAIGLALLIVFYKLKGGISFDLISLLKS